MPPSVHLVNTTQTKHTHRHKVEANSLCYNNNNKNLITSCHISKLNLYQFSFLILLQCSFITHMAPALSFYHEEIFFRFRLLQFPQTNFSSLTTSRSKQSSQTQINTTKNPSTIQKELHLKLSKAIREEITSKKTTHRKNIANRFHIMNEYFQRLFLVSKSIPCKEHTIEHGSIK